MLKDRRDTQQQVHRLADRFTSLREKTQREHTKGFIKHLKMFLFEIRQKKGEQSDVDVNKTTKSLLAARPVTIITLSSHRTITLLSTRSTYRTIT